MAQLAEMKAAFKGVDSDNDGKVRTKIGEIEREEKSGKDGYRQL